MTSRILVTGSTGFIGRHLTQDLIKKGHDVRVLVRNPQKARSLFADAVDVCTGDLCEPAALKRACAGVEIVYHIGGIFRFGVRRRREIYRTNIEGTENLFSAAGDARKIVHVSSASVLDKPRTSSDPWPILNETDFPSLPPRFSPYKYSKWEAERRAAAWARRGLPVVIASLSCPVGFGDETPTPTGQMIRDFIQGRFPCYCQTGLNFANVSDVSDGLQRVARTGRVGERYLLTNQNMWLKEFLDYLANQCGLPSPRYCLPNWSIQAMGCLGEIYDLLKPGSTTARICLETAIQAPKVQFYDNAKACHELGWSPTSPKSGIRQAIAWFQNEPVPAYASRANCAPVKT
jgi:dihydroflavonol-4-reductase